MNCSRILGRPWTSKAVHFWGVVNPPPQPMERCISLDSIPKKYSKNLFVSAVQILHPHENIIVMLGV